MCIVKFLQDYKTKILKINKQGRKPIDEDLAIFINIMNEEYCFKFKREQYKLLV